LSAAVLLRRALLAALLSTAAIAPAASAQPRTIVVE
jgi:hypothetical protein